LLHVLENAYVLYPPEAGGAANMVLADLTKSASDNLNGLAMKLAAKHKIEVNYLVQSGNPADEICRGAHHSKANLIVLGTHGSSGLREFFIGSNAYRVVKNAPCPVMSVPGTNQWTDFKKMLFPVRMIPHALDKYDIIRPIIRKNGSSLFIAGIVNRNDAIGVIEMCPLINTIQTKIAEDDVICGSEVYFCEVVAKQVLAVSNLEKPDLIVITATLDTTIKEFFLGPYTQDIVNHAKFPVLSIRPEVSKTSTAYLTSMVKKARPLSAMFYESSSQ
ncbi:MAG: universal stress protein, partial [Bacteroidetes bacterium]|nr:universal stress protein [Bacteroidota bacterium]